MREHVQFFFHFSFLSIDWFFGLLSTKAQFRFFWHTFIAAKQSGLMNVYLGKFIVAKQQQILCVIYYCLDNTFISFSIVLFITASFLLHIVLINCANRFSFHITTYRIFFFLLFFCLVWKIRIFFLSIVLNLHESEISFSKIGIGVVFFFKLITSVGDFQK